MGFTLGLGEIEVNSALNQKLNADIELLSATPEDSETLIVKLASRKEFSRAGLDRPYLLNDLRFKSTIIDGTPHINVSSGSPIREPFLNFLVEIDWPNGHMIREYTVLLDPPVFMTQAASNAAATNNQAATANGGFRPSSSGAVVPVVTPVPTSGAAASSRPQAAVQPVKQQGAATDQAVYPATNPAFVPAPVMQQTVVNQPAGSYRIKSGDTAWSLADAMRPDQSISVEQMMIAMLRSNPESFINENVNGLKRGYILRVPDYDQVTAVSQQEARALVREQAGLWRQFQQTQAGGQPVSAMPSGTSGGAGVEGGSAAGDDSAYLEIVSAGSGSSTISGKDPTDMTPEELRAELALARERVETEKVEKEALQQRIDELELNAGTREGMMSIEDDALSDVQALGQSELDESGPGESDVAVTGGDMIDPQAEQELRDTLAELSGDVESTEDGSIEGEAADSEVMDAEAESADAELVETEEAVFVDESEDSAAEVEIVEQEVVSEPQSDMAAESQLVDRTPPADPLSQLLNDPMLLAAAGGGLLLIVAVIGLFIRRRKAAAEEEPVVNAFDDIESIASDVADEAAGDASAEDETQSLAGQSLAGEQSESTDDAELDKQADDFDSDATTMLDATEDTIVTEAAAKEEPRDDVIAEADVYLAYGIYQQAEELLTQAIAD
ncbi:MAG: hypothetical protein IMF14_08215, partial [Proteobacteria bacterium]|nr:hypothetical protein [Pseudomonadota bacterium]